MTEKHGVECATTIETDDKDDEDHAKEVLEKANLTANVSEQTCANATKEVSAIDIKEASSDVEEIYVDAENTRATISWSLEGNEFKVSWSLPEGVATPKDYIGICYAGELIILLSIKLI